MSINTLFEMSRRSFRASNAGMEAAGQNIANAGTEGYRRRRISMKASNTASPGLYTAPAPGTATGNGVTANGYGRVRDRMLDSAAAQAQTGHGAAKEEARLLTQLEGTFATGTPGALPDAMESFWGGWNDVASAPGDGGTRRALLGKTDTLVSSFRSIDQGLDRLRGDAQQALSENVAAVNERLQEVASLNETISNARAGGSPDLVAEDRRDTLVSELSEPAPVEVQEGDAAGYTLTIGGMSVVQGGNATPLQQTGPGTVEFGESGVAFQPGDEGGGTLGAQVRTLTDTLPDVQAQLDGLAEELVQKVNAAHESGFDPGGEAGGPFFDPGGTTAATLARAVEAPDDVAAIAAPGQPGNTAPAQDIAALSEELTPGAIDLVAGVGAEVERASAQEESQAALADHLEGMARGVSGVSTDEEMTHLIEHQQSFAASARVLNTAQQVMDTLLSL